MTSLLEPIQLGDVLLRNRIVVAPVVCTQPCNGQADGRIPDTRMRAWYAQRAAAGLIVTQATAVSPLGVGCPDTLGIWSSDQIQGWRAITNSVHAAGGRIFLRLLHAGRVSDPEYLSGAMPVAPSAIACVCDTQTPSAHGGFVVPRGLHGQEIRSIVSEFEQAANHARLAQFDGVEIQAGDGYLIDQFLHDGSNHRHDEYGGSISNRCRFLLDVVDACIGVWGAGRVGVHVSPHDDKHDMIDSDPVALYRHVARQLDLRRLAFMCVRERLDPQALTPIIRQAFGGVLVLNEGYDEARARQAMADGLGDAVAFGRAFLSNPDLVQRLAQGEPLRPLSTPELAA